MKKKRVIFRVHASNALTIPLLVGIVENSLLMKEVDLVVSGIPVVAAPGDLIIYSIMTPFLPKLAAEIARMKELGALVVIGGPHVDHENFELLLRMGATSVSAAKAETDLIPIIETALDGRLPDHPFWPERPISMLDFSAFIPICTRLPTVPPLELMRGCGYSCLFCATSGRKRMIRTWSSIELYLKQLQERGGRRVNFIVPSALDFSMSGLSVEESLLMLFEECRKKEFRHIEFGIFPSEIRPETVTLQKLELLKRYVVNRKLTIGIQSGSQNRLRQLRRFVDQQQLENAIETVRSAGFGLNLDLIVGFPDESMEEFSQSLDMALSLRKSGKTRLQVHRFFPLGNSPWQWLKPSEIDKEKHQRLSLLEGAGEISSGWQINDKQWHSYRDWLIRDYPDWAEKYRSGH